MSINQTRAREKLVISIHFTLYPGVDDNFIHLVRTTPRRSLARRVCEAMQKSLAQLNDINPKMDSMGVNHD
jgi:hypothetical protein